MLRFFSYTQKVIVAFGKLERRVWSDKHITIKTKVIMYMACGLMSPVYSSETWTQHTRGIYNGLSDSTKSAIDAAPRNKCTIYKCAALGRRDFKSYRVEALYERET